MSVLAVDTILSCKNVTLSDFRILELELSKGEWLHILIHQDNRRKDLVEALLFRNDVLQQSYFNGDYSFQNNKDKQSLRRRISYWPVDFHDITDENYIRQKEMLTGFKRTALPDASRTFLDHLMLIDELPGSYKRMIYALLMNAPEVLIIDRALDIIDNDFQAIILKYITRYSRQSGMAIINLTADKSTQDILRARMYHAPANELLELMNHEG